MKPPPITLVGARLWEDPAVPREGAAPELVDVNIGTEGRIASIEATGAQPPKGARVIDLDGRWIMPGLMDHHVHFTMWAKHRGRVSLAGAKSADDVVDVVRGALVDHPVLSLADVEPLVGSGYQDALWPEPPTAAMLDEVAVHVGQYGRPIVLISHDLHSVWINTAAGERYGVPAGLLRENAAFELEMALEAEEMADPRRIEVLVSDAANAAASRGVTGIMDLEMADNPLVWASRITSGIRALRVIAGVYPRHLAESLARGERTGKRVPGTKGQVTVGPLKVFADGALNTRTAWCFDSYPGTSDFGHAAQARGDLERILADAREVGFDVALHAIGDRAVSEALDAFAASGVGGSIEHAQMVREQDVARMAALGVAAGIHPEHLLDDREVMDVMWSGRTHRAFPYGDFARAGVSLRLGSDAPVAPLDPWLGISAAVHRTRDEQPAWEPGNALDIGTALRASWASPTLAPGVRADVAVIEADPSTSDVTQLRDMPVALTLLGGRVTHDALDA
ncbi:amidohydrolase family protein [Demequina sp. TTPB684]|uniref:amidohydrolase n=1 Tax=unclassified Demequina TaxID=2620311 RepID=UPI001CF1A339|nr:MULTISPECIES: amidohydrolase family protein [unclassified Demequina]MCB2413970.1 amidohydrolase family protein [Demequina sp. TTPB684]UPU88676.1 amidohydrolase family protein [Demequina sp. TMPB413]